MVLAVAMAVAAAMVIQRSTSALLTLCKAHCLRSNRMMR
jgi:hypothetical protein